jgi:iron-sulfur cluster insertion protein
MNALSTQDLAISAGALEKLAELLGNVEDEIHGIRVYATPGGCSGMSFGMTFADSIGDTDLVGDHGSVKVIVDVDTIGHLRGAEIDFIDRGDGNASFVFNNIPRPTGGGCSSGGCGGGGGGCA